MPRESAKGPSTPQWIYLCLFVIGTAVPLYLLGEFILQEGLNTELAGELSFANNINSAWAWDVILSSTTFFVFAVYEIRRLKMPWWLLLPIIPLDFVLGLCCALPLFLFWREKYLRPLEPSE